ncbi:MAG: FAD-dependent oxidoreductase [Dehalococcoidia bacterium]
MAKFGKMFEPAKIGTMEVKNRLVMAPMGCLDYDDKGYVTDSNIDYYRARADGGVGLIILGATFPIYEGGPAAHASEIYDDRFVPRLKDLADAIHESGAKVLVQLLHMGRVESQLRYQFADPEKVDVIGPSPVAWALDNSVPREMSHGDIEWIVERFVEGAQRAQKAGFDGVEIHAAHGYLLHSFLSPFYNRRTDKYGGSPANRARFACEILAAVRKAVGPDFALTIRISAKELLNGGIKLEDVLRQAPMYVGAGANAINVSVCGEDNLTLALPSYLEPEGVNVHLAEAIKKVVDVPVITVGRLGNPVVAGSILQEGRADFVALGRPLLADPEWPNKVRAGKLQEINHCICCNNCFLALWTGGWRGLGAFGCTVNPALFQEGEYPLKLTTSPKKVMVIGGGIAGMQAARDLALRGHQVLLYEKSAKLGGQWNIACMQEGKQVFALFSERLARDLRASARVKIIFNTEVTPDLVREVTPDTVVMATGARPAALNVPTLNCKNVVQAVDVIAGRAQTGQRVVVIGGRFIGMELALSLAEQDKKVSLVTRRNLGRDTDKSIYTHLRDRLIEREVQILTNSPIYEIRENGVYVNHQNQLLFLKADTIVLAVGSVPENTLAEQLRDVISEIHLIGDCVEPRNALDATREATAVARRI